MNQLDAIRRSRVLSRYYHEQGAMRTLRWLFRKLKAKVFKSSIFQKTDVLKGFEFITLPSVSSPARVSECAQNTLNWFIPPFGRGSGGHLNIFRFIANLEELGFDCNIVIVANAEPLDHEEVLQENIQKWFVPLRAKVFKGIENAPPAHVTLATEWRTAYFVRSFAKTNHRCYFVQDFEPWFFPIGSEYFFAEETYRFGFTGITAGGWLKDKLAKEYGMKTHAVGFSYERGLYQPAPSAASANRSKRVFFYARPPTPRRAFELGLMALKEVSQRIPYVEVVLAGWDLNNIEIPFKHKDLGILSVAELPGVYQSCDVALVLSLTNLSLLPLELMACGVPIVSNEGPNNEWLLNAYNSKLTRTTPGHLANAICHVLSDSDEAQRLRGAGLETARRTNWKDEAKKMAAILKSLD